jgi:hypothetical protein
LPEECAKEPFQSLRVLVRMKDFLEKYIIADPDAGFTLAEEEKFLPELIVEGIVNCERVRTGFQPAEYLLAGKDVALKQILDFFFCHSFLPFAFFFSPQGFVEVGECIRRKGGAGSLRIA